MATSINQVEADTSYVDPSGSVAYCRSAAEYEDARSELISRYVKDLTVFVWTWIAFEKAIDILCRRSQDRIGDAVKYIKRRLGRFTIVGLPEVEERTLDLIRPLVEVKIRQKMVKLIEEREWIDQRHLVWLYVLREGRNCIVHGEIRDVEPDDWGLRSTYRGEHDKHVVTVGVLTRLSLFALQMLLLAATQDGAHRIEDDSMGFPENALLQDVLKIVHLDEDDYFMDAGQLQLRIDDAEGTRRP